MLVSVPVELRQCVRLVELSLEHNTLDRPLLDFRTMADYKFQGYSVIHSSSFLRSCHYTSFNTCPLPIKIVADENLRSVNMQIKMENSSYFGASRHNLSAFLSIFRFHLVITFASLCTGQDNIARLVDVDMISSDDRHLLMKCDILQPIDVSCPRRTGFHAADVYCWQAGAIVANNPSIFTIREAQLLWPDTKIDCLVSISCGSFTYKDIISYWRIKFRDLNFLKERKGGWRYVDTGQVLVESACSVDRLEALSTLLPMLPEMQYFRFNPVYFQLIEADVLPAPFLKLPLTYGHGSSRNCNCLSPAYGLSWSHTCMSL
ncbi:Calcium-independent phospholipase A2-gamma [Corchorus olitorius]|uniref:Calcium-independent phospholipase A2-gamma n=1 Tax=Corchorus olitorius TaxID=93759 RepID=A0A1R3JA21_9ROSI|nr:Calcium-independent phospholipase A2-gamma [Corchorus olitorius]